MSDTYYKAQDLNYGFFSSVKNETTPLSKLYNIYIETDASGASSIFGMAPHFKELHSIQLNKKIKKELTDNYTGEKIKWYSNRGSSLSALSTICPNIKSPAFFYLNYNNYHKDNDCLIDDYVKKIVSSCEQQSIVCIDSFGLINGCLTISDADNSVLLEQIIESCGTRLSNNYTVGSTSNGRYRIVLHLKTMI